MQINFAGTIIAKEADFYGLDRVTGFVPKGRGNTEWQEFLRATDATPKARGNRKRTLTGRIIPPTAPDLATAMMLRGTLYNNLPDAGVLQIQVGTQLLTFAAAVLETHDVIEEFTGVGVGFALSFAVGRGAVSTLATHQVLSQTGQPLIGQSGNPLESQT